MTGQSARQTSAEIPSPRVAVAAIGRASQKKDAEGVRDARRQLAAAKINDAITRSLKAADGLHADQVKILIARLKEFAR